MVIVGLFLEIIIHIICISVLVPLKTMRQRRRRVRSRNMYIKDLCARTTGETTERGREGVGRAKESNGGK